MKKSRLGFILLLSVFALFFCGCGNATEEELLPFAYSGSDFFEYYDVGNDRNADFLKGRATEVCIPSETTTEEIDSKDYVYALYHVSDNQMLEEHGILEKIYPASVTKLLTSYLALKYCDLSEPVTFSYNASHIGVYELVSG